MKETNYDTKEIITINNNYNQLLRATHINSLLHQGVYKIDKYQYHNQTHTQMPCSYPSSIDSLEAVLQAFQHLSACHHYKVPTKISHTAIGTGYTVVFLPGKGKSLDRSTSPERCSAQRGRALEPGTGIHSLRARWFP